ncbi:hypothetical protein [Marinobacterium aestuariivivens]|uniref:Phasin domain-containing protein n=1 Tax=Marinobacterium aestuariivivens TaxID=1698799 RepID=A0ABW2A058_9GAMM
MTTKVDFQKPFEAVQTLMNIQVSAITKSVEQQKKTGEELASFFKTEVEKARELKSPEDVISYNVAANQALFELLKAQGEAFTAIANEAREAATAEFSKLAK